MRRTDRSPREFRRLLDEADALRDRHAFTEATGSAQRAMAVLGKSRRPRRHSPEESAQRSRALSILGECSTFKLQLDLAAAQFDEALVAARAAADRDMEARALSGALTVRIMRAEDDTAIEDARACCRLAEECNDLGTRIMALEAAVIKFRLLDYRTEAAELVSNALQLARAGGGPADIAKALNLRGMLRGARYDASPDDLAAAAEDFEHARELYESVGLRGRSAGPLHNKAAWCLGQEYLRKLELLNEALAINTETGNLRWCCVNWMCIGDAWAGLQKFSLAKESYESALRTVAAAGWVGLEIDLLHQLGYTLELLADYPQALTYRARALALAETHPAGSRLAYALMGIGSLCAEMGDATQAEVHFSRALSIGREVGDRYVVANALGAMGTTYLEAGDFDAARENFGEAIQASGGFAYRRDIVGWMCGLARISHTSGDLEAARDGYCETLRFARDVGESEDVANTLRRLGEVLSLQGNHTAALQRLKEALELAESADIKREAMEIHRALAEVFSRLGSYAEACDHFRKYDVLRTEILSEDSRKQLELFTIRREIADRERQVEIEHLRAEHLEREVKRQQQELTNKALQLVQQTEMIQGFRTELEGMLHGAESAESAIRAIRRKIKELPDNVMNWERFIAEFRAVHPEFEGKLKESYSALSKTEVKVCCLLRIGMSTREIATLLFVAERTVDCHRWRLRRKLGLTPFDDVHEVLAGV